MGKTVTRADIVANLRRVLDEAPAESFAMQRFQCGTARCLLGWAWVDPWFRKNTAVDCLLYENGDRLRPTQHITELEDVFLHDGDDLNRLFGFRDIFDDLYDVTKEDVSRNLDRLAAGEPTIPYFTDRMNRLGLRPTPRRSRS